MSIGLQPTALRRRSEWGTGRVNHDKHSAPFAASSCLLTSAMTKGGPGVGGITRRQFGRGAAAGIVLVGTAGITGLGLAFTDHGMYGFAVEHDDSVKVRVGNGERFTLEVIDRSSGDVLQRETDLDVGRLLALQSDQVRFYRITPPGL